MRRHLSSASRCEIRITPSLAQASARRSSAWEAESLRSASSSSFGGQICSFRVTYSPPLPSMRWAWNGMRFPCQRKLSTPQLESPVAGPSLASLRIRVVSVS